MTEQFGTEESNNTYVLDAESAVEMARLLDQDKVLTQAMGGIFPEQADSDLPNVSCILDIACGPGGWAFEVARSYPHIEVTGIDISKNTIEYARAQAKLLNLSNVHFEVMDALKSLQFTDNTFDLVNMRTVVAFVVPELWPQFLQECKRVLKPGGVIRVTEAELGISSKPAFETLMQKLALAIRRANRSFSPIGTQIGITPFLRPLLEQAGFQQVKMKPHVVDSSYGSPGHEGSYQDIKMLLEISRPLLVQTRAITEQEFDALGPQVLQEMQEEDYYGLGYMLTVWGVKP
jgi:ubiquinone/menaquinone biosynthesis C-methylase UbiE